MSLKKPRPRWLKGVLNPYALLQPTQAKLARMRELGVDTSDASKVRAFERYGEIIS